MLLPAAVYVHPVCAVSRVEHAELPGRLSVKFAVLARSGVPRKLPRGGHFSRPRKVDDLFFVKLPSVDVFFGVREVDDVFFLFFLITDPNSTSIVSQILKGGGICPSTCFLVFFKSSKISFRHPKGEPWTSAPPGYATACTASARNHNDSMRGAAEVVILSNNY
jgi:hypothetical protein